MNERDRLVKMLEKAEEKAEAYLRENDHMDYIPTLKEILGVYADSLLESGVIVPPCKVGDTVYQQDGVRIYESVIEKITIDIAAGRPNKMIFYTNKITFDQTAVGRIIFLTPDEAEAALAERRDNR